MKILFIAGFGPVVEDRIKSKKFYADAIGISFKEEEEGYLHTSEIDGCKSFALWPLSQAAESCFGVDKWPEELPTPKSWLEFDVEDMEAAANEMEKKGYRLLVKNRKEPWGQTVTRFLDPDGILVGLTYSPWLREKA